MDATSLRLHFGNFMPATYLPVYLRLLQAMAPAPLRSVNYSIIAALSMRPCIACNWQGLITAIKHPCSLAASYKPALFYIWPSAVCICGRVYCNFSHVANNICVT